MPEVVAGLLMALLFAASWISAIALICWRADGRLLSDRNGAFPSQSSQWRGINAR